ncbi:MAG TPA: hypothetical protein VGN12_02065 [Pirellulales bacterium]|jgi:hypothetical protein
MQHHPATGFARLGTSTVWLAILLCAWFALDFIGWSGLVEREPLVSLAGLMLLLMLLFIAGGLWRISYVAFPNAIALSVWAFLQWQTHWSSYFFAAGPQKLAWYGRAFGRHWHLLSDRAAHTTPDVYHTVLAVLILVNLVSVGRDIVGGLLSRVTRNSTLSP